MIIDKIFIINLEHRVDRKTHILNQLKKYNIENFEFFNGIKPSAIEIIKWNKKFCNHVNRDIKYKTGCLGCLKSHYEIMTLSLLRGYKTILILEDDTVFNDSYYQLDSYINQINNNFDMLYLSGSHLGTKIFNSTNTDKVSGTYTTGSYLITENAMNYLINNIKGYDKEIDVFYAEEIQPKFNCYCVNPHITYQLDGYSDIQHDYVQYKLSNKIIK